MTLRCPCCRQEIKPAIEADNYQDRITLHYPDGKGALSVLPKKNTASCLATILEEWRYLWVEHEKAIVREAYQKSEGQIDKESGT